MASLSTELITGDGRILTVGDIAQCYRDIVNISVPVQGKIQKLGEDFYSLTTEFNTVDCDTLEKVKTRKIYSLTTKSKCVDAVRCVSDAFEVSELAIITSENGRFTARLKAPKKQQDSNSERQLLEIWDRSKLLKTIDTSELEAHGSINTDSVFAHIVWTTAGNQDKLLYVCQQKRPKFLSFFKEPKVSKAGDSEDKTNRGEEYTKREDWGECCAGIEHTIVAVLDVSNNCQISTIDMTGYSLGNPQWLENGNKVVCEAYPEDPRRLGLVYCNNRPCKLMIFDWASSSAEPVTILGSPTESYHSPRSTTGDKFVFLINATFGAHRHSVKFACYDLRTKEQKSLPVDLSGCDLFINEFQRNCFTDDGKHILFVSEKSISSHMYLYTLETNKVTEIKFPNPGISILDFRYNVILACGSDIDATPTLFAGTIDPSNTNDVVAWHQMEECIHLEDIEYETYKIPTQDKTSFISAILSKPNLKALQANLNEKTFNSKHKLESSIGQLPTVVVIHGGPHSNFSPRFMPRIVLLSRLGLKVMIINYRGSTGVTQEYVDSLCGKIGQLDVSDCLEGIRYFAQNKLIDPSKLIIEGGSHGGFIAGHLSCQDEFQFTSAILRNPVIDLQSCHATSDIPDWAINETFGFLSHDPTWLPSSDEIVEMRNKSPMYYVSQTNVPTLMLLGNKDRRVPMFQGERWADALKARGVEVQCKIYPDNHSLTRTEVQADLCVLMGIWILNHLPKF